MPVGPGKYDDLATLVRRKALAAGVAVLVFGGKKGSGFAVQFSAGTDPRESANWLRSVVGMLRSMADQIEADLPDVAAGKATTPTD